METPISPKISLERLCHVAAQQFDIRIASDGRWFHEGDEIRRIELVKLFASILVLDDKGDYWLATPAEKGRITVDDAPFIIRDMTVKIGARSQQNEICFQTNIDETVLLDIKHPLQLCTVAQSSDLRPILRCATACWLNYHGRFITNLQIMPRLGQMAGLVYGATINFFR